VDLVPLACCAAARRLSFSGHDLDDGEFRQGTWARPLPMAFEALAKPCKKETMPTLNAEPQMALQTAIGRR
jgi:hypothetical protein